MNASPAPSPSGELHVAYLVNHYPKVSHSFIRREIRALERQGVRVERFSVRGQNDTLVDPEDREERTRTRYVLGGGFAPLFLATLSVFFTRPLAFFRALGDALRFSRRSERPWPVHLVYLAEACLLLGWLKKSGVSHLHAHFGTNSTEVALLVHALGGPPFSFTVHGPEEFDKPEALGLGRKIERAAFVVAISSYGRSQLYRQVASSHWSRIAIVHCGLEAAFHAGTPSPPSAAPRLVCVGRLCEQKGQLLLVDAAARVAARGVPFELVLAGDGEMRREIEARIAEHDLAARTTITGWISSSRVREEILAARALVMPSFAEGLPVAIMEALALNRPVLSTFVAGIPELVRPDREGWLVPAGDVAALADAIEVCLGTPLERASEIAEAGRRRVLERHDVDTEAKKLRALFATTHSSARDAAE